MVDIAGAYVTIRPDFSGFRAEVVTGLTAAMAGVHGDVPIDGTTSPLQAKVAEGLVIVRSFAAQTAEARIGADDSMLAAVMAKDQAELNALGAEVIRPTIIPEVDDTAALAKLAGLDAAAGESGRGGSVGLGSILAGGLLGGMFHAGGGGGGGDSGGGMLGAMGWGKGMLGMAGFGSLLGMLGFGGEHLIATGLGVAGSAGGAAIGGGLLGLGALGTMAVGGGSDLAVMKSTMTNVKTLSADYNALSQAVAVYGANSRQARVATAQLNYDLSNIAPVARSAVAGVAQAANTLGGQWQAAIAQAEVAATRIMQQTLHLAATFVPLVAHAAQVNLTMISSGLKPLFAWLESGGGGASLGNRMHSLLSVGSADTGGLSIFKDLEQVFQSNLPSAIHAITQGVEMFAKTVDVAAHYTGGFVRAIDGFLTRMNSPAAFAKWSGDIGKLIGMFRTWASLLVTAGKTLVDVFTPAAGAGTALVRVLTQMLHSVDLWLVKTSTRNALHGLFSAHLKELIQGIGGAIKAALPIIESMALGFIHVATVGATVATQLIKPVTAFFKLIDAHPIAKKIIEWATAFALVGKAFTALLDLNPWLLGIAAGIEAVYLLATHWSTVWNGIKKVASVVWDWIKRDWPLVLAVFGPVGALVELAAHWKTIWDGIKTVASGVWDWIKSHWRLLLEGVVAALTGPMGLVVTYMATHWRQVQHDATVIWGEVVSFVRTVPGLIVGALSALGGLLSRAASAAWHSFLTASQTGWGDIRTFVAGIPGKIVSALGDLSGLLTGAGRAVLDGFLSGLQSVWHKVTSFIGGIGSWISSHKGPIGYDATLLTPHGMAIMQGLHAGLLAGFEGQVVPLIRSMGPVVAGAFPGASVGTVGWATGSGRVSGIGADSADLLAEMQAIRAALERMPTAVALLKRTGAL